MSCKCPFGCTCGRHTAKRASGYTKPSMRVPVDEQRLRELAGTLSQTAIAAELGISRKVVQSRMRELGIAGRPASQTWQAQHVRTRKARGPAREQSCSHCGEQARDWAQIHGRDGADPWKDFTPLCRSCHLKYDYEARHNPESEVRWREKAGPAISAAWTDERRSAQAERMRAMRAMRANGAPGRL